jgi:hypothetical protein
MAIVFVFLEHKTVITDICHLGFHKHDLSETTCFCHLVKGGGNAPIQMYPVIKTSSIQGAHLSRNLSSPFYLITETYPVTKTLFENAKMMDNVYNNSRLSCFQLRTFLKGQLQPCDNILTRALPSCWITN